MSKKSGGGIGFAGLLTVLFIALTLTHVINWSWLWVLSPLWLGAAVILVALILILTFGVFAEIIEEFTK